MAEDVSIEMSSLPSPEEDPKLPQPAVTPTDNESGLRRCPIRFWESITKWWTRSPSRADHPHGIPTETVKPPLTANEVLCKLETDDDGWMKQMVHDGYADDVLRPRRNDWSLEFVSARQSRRIIEHHSTSLHVAAELGAVKCLRVLLDHKKSHDYLQAFNLPGFTALLVAVQYAQPEALQQLLDAGANVNARNSQGFGALHILVLLLSDRYMKEEKQRRLLKVADLLLSPTHVSRLDLEPHAEFAGLTNATPLVVAAALLQEGDEAPGLIELCKKLVTAGASLSETVQQVLIQKGCLTPELLEGKQQSLSRPTAAHVIDVVSMGGNSDEVSQMLREESPEDARNIVNSLLGGNSLLFHAVNTTKTSLVEVLLHHGADPWTENVSGELPLHCAADKGHVDIFSKLLGKMKGKNETPDLRKYSFSLILKLVDTRYSKDTPQDRDRIGCLRHLLEEKIKLDLNTEIFKRTALHVAAVANNQEAVQEMLRDGFFLGARQTIMEIDFGTALYKVLPATLKGAMDDCITYDGDDEAEDVMQKEYMLRLDYRFLVPPQQEDTESVPKPANELETLMEVCRSKWHRHLIKHPLVQTLLYAKWREARPFYFANVVLYLIFVVMLTVFVYSLMDLYLLEARLSRLHHNGTTDANLEASEEGQRSRVYELEALLLLACVYMLVREVFQIKFLGRLYFKSIENYLELSLLVAVVLLCFAPREVDYTRHLAAWAMISAWCNFGLVVGHAPALALYITMLRQVSWNFVKLIISFIVFILAFTLSFNILLQSSGDQSFSNLWTTLPKTIVMATGEFEYSDLSERSPKLNSGLNEGFPKTMVMISAILVFLVFLFFIFLVMMNVMNGLAVIDTQKVVEDAKLHSLNSRLDLVYLVENFYLRCSVLCSFFLCCPFPYLRRMGNIQLLSGQGNDPYLMVNINHYKKNEYLLSPLEAFDKHYKKNQPCLSSIRTTINQFKENLQSCCTHRQDTDETPCKLDRDTTECLRDYWLQRLQEEEIKKVTCCTCHCRNTNSVTTDSTNC